jgi:broad specificity phosphatase PhoE
MTDIYLVRHGQARTMEWQAYGPDPPLTALGRAQAAERAAWLAARGPFAALYCSPLRRARQTAVIAGRQVGLRPVVVPPLAEWEPPRYLSPLRRLVNRGLRRALAGETPSGFLMRGMRDELGVWRAVRGRLPPWQRFVRRVGRVTAALAARHPDERIIVVCHGGTIRGILSYFGVAPPGLFHFDTLGLCSVSVLRLAAGEGRGVLALFDECAAIPRSRFTSR